LITEVQPVQTNGVERVKRFVNTHLHCIVSNLKRISKISMLLPLENFLLTPMLMSMARHWQSSECVIQSIPTELLRRSQLSACYKKLAC